MKKAASLVIAMLLIIVITIGAASALYYWLSEMQSEMQSGTKQYQKELTEDISGKLSIVNFRHEFNTKSAKAVMENSGSRRIKNIGSSTDKLVITSKDSSCDIAFNSSTCDACPFDLDVGEAKEINLQFARTGCENLLNGIEYIGRFVLRDGYIQAAFTPVTVADVWTAKHPLQNPDAETRFGIAAVGGTDNVVLFGGGGPANCDGSGAGYCNGTWAYDLSENSWTRKTTPSLLTWRYRLAMAPINGTDKVVIFGGGRPSQGDCDNSSSAMCNGTWVYDYSDDTWTRMSTPLALIARYDPEMAMIDGTDQVLMFGGLIGSGTCDGSTNGRCNGTWVYDYSDDTWTMYGTPVGLSARFWHRMAAIDGTDKVLLFGGTTDGSLGGAALADTWFYDASDGAWTQKNFSYSPTGRYEYGLATVSGTDKVAMYGGVYADGVLADTWVYDLSDDAWTKSTPLDFPAERFRHGLSSVDGISLALLSGGTYQGNETWTYVPP